MPMCWSGQNGAIQIDSELDRPVNMILIRRRSSIQPESHIIWFQVNVYSFRFRLRHEFKDFQGLVLLIGCWRKCKSFEPHANSMEN